MTTPPEEVIIRCTTCGHRSSKFIRRSINISLGDKFTRDEIDDATIFECPMCQSKMPTDTIIFGWE